jgi:hypothetical protein
MVRAFLIVSLVTVVLSGPGCDQATDRNPVSPPTAPVLSVLSPSQAAIGDTVTLRGSGFAAADNGVRIGEGYVLGIASADTTSLAFALPSALTPCPPGAQACIALAVPLNPGTYPVAVVNAKGTSNTLPLQVIAR